MTTRSPFSTRVDDDLLRRTRAAAAAVIRIDPRYSLAQLVEDALVAHLDRLAEQYDLGETWEDSAGELRPGRRLAP